MKLKILRVPRDFSCRYIKRGIYIPSRFFLAPINTGFAPNGLPDQRFIDFYNQRSGGGLGITYIGNVSVGKKWVTNSNTPWISYNSLHVWRKLSSIISRNGSIPGIQLACRASSEKPFQGWMRTNAENFIKRVRNQLADISTHEINRILEAFINSACLSVKAGFKVIQIHAAHGYFLSQLLDPRLNRRKDCFGTNPVSAIHTIVSAIRAIDSDILIDLRISLAEGFEDWKVEYARKLQILKRLVKTGLDMISLSNGIYDFNKNLIYPPKTWGHGPYIKMAIPLSQMYSRLIWNIAGNIWDIRKLPDEIPKNLTFGIGRALIADPKLIEKSLSGTFEAIQWCVRKGDCHYFIHGRDYLCCPLEPSLNCGFTEASISCLKDT